MKRLIFCLTIVLSLAGLGHYADSREPVKTQPSMEVLFSPGGGCEARIVAELGKAKTAVRIQAYSFTNATIAKALLDAKKRGVQVEAILDKSNRSDRYTAATFLRNADVPVAIDAKHAIAHNKIMIIDDSTVITGSYNFTRAAEERNAENLLIIQSPDLAKRYLQNWQHHKAHSEAF